MISNDDVLNFKIEHFKSVLEEMKYANNDECEPLRLSLLAEYKKSLNENNKMYIIIFEIFRKILDTNIDYEIYRKLLFDFIEEVIYYDQSN